MSASHVRVRGHIGVAEVAQLGQRRAVIGLTTLAQQWLSLRSNHRRLHLRNHLKLPPDPELLLLPLGPLQLPQLPETSVQPVYPAAIASYDPLKSAMPSPSTSTLPPLDELLLFEGGAGWQVLSTVAQFLMTVTFLGSTELGFA